MSSFPHLSEEMYLQLMQIVISAYIYMIVTVSQDDNTLFYYTVQLLWIMNVIEQYFICLCLLWDFCDTSMLV